MAKKDERYLNITLKNQEEEKDSFVIPVAAIFKNIKKYFAVWLVTAAVSALLVFSGSALISGDEHKTLSALINFTYSGIEKGLDPAGKVFDVNTVKNPEVIKDTLEELKLPLDDIDSLRSSITIEGIVPDDVIDKITTYKGIIDMGSNSAMSAAQEILSTDYNPTQYKVQFNYADTDFSGSEAVEFLNTMLDCYRDYFFRTYGYNEALGSAVTVLDYNDYDYAEALDVFSTSLSSLKSYVDTLSAGDTTRFRSTATGYTFSDLSDSINTLRSIDLDVISSYIAVNNVTKDKESLINYYDYRIEELTRQQAVQKERLTAITESLNAYEKDQIIIFGNGNEDTNTQSTVGSEEYNKLINEKISAQTNVSNTTQEIAKYKLRLVDLKSNKSASPEHIEKVETDLAALSVKITQLIEDVNATADDYYETVALANAYNILVPASTSTIDTITGTLKSTFIPILVVEALVLVVYIILAFTKAVAAENKKKLAAESAVIDDDNVDDEDDDKNEPEAEKKTDAKKKK